MSNKIVPAVYRAVIDDVIAHIKPEFEEYGVSEDVLAELQQKWQDKIMASNVAEFDPPAAPAPMATHAAASYPAHPLAHMLPGLSAYATSASGQPSLLPNGLPYLAGPQIPGARPGQPIMSYPPGTTLSRAPMAAGTPQPPPAGVPRYPVSVAAPGLPRLPHPDAGSSIPQVDGPASSGSEDEPAPASSGYAPRASHPSLQPQPSQASTSAPVPDDEAINSDLDDTDEDEDEDEGNTALNKDLVFCTYDKVNRVRNKWKCVFKDGMIHVNGKDYLFAKCNGEFEWM